MKLPRSGGGETVSVAGLPLQMRVEGGCESVRHWVWSRRRVGGSKVEGVKMERYSTAGWRASRLAAFGSDRSTAAAA